MGPPFEKINPPILWSFMNPLIFWVAALSSPEDAITINNCPIFSSRDIALYLSLTHPIWDKVSAVTNGEYWPRATSNKVKKRKDGNKDAEEQVTWLYFFPAWSYVKCKHAEKKPDERQIIDCTYYNACKRLRKEKRSWNSMTSKIGISRDIYIETKMKPALYHKETVTTTDIKLLWLIQFIVNSRTNFTVSSFLLLLN